MEPTSANDPDGLSFALVLCDPKPALCDALRRQFAGFSLVSVVDGPFENVPDFDCVVSAGNSFGLMDGGVDLALVQFFGQALEARVQRIILDRYRGEQPVGTCELVETGNQRHPFVAHAPTMRVPMTIARTDNVYRAFRAVLLAIQHHNEAHEDQSESVIKIVMCSGLGTGAGQVPFEEAARQMASAYRSFLNPPRKISWKHAHDMQAQIRYGGDIGFAIPPRAAKPKP